MIEKAKVRRDYAKLKSRTDDTELQYGHEEQDTTHEPELRDSDDALADSNSFEVKPETRRNTPLGRPLVSTKLSSANASIEEHDLRDVERKTVARANHLKNLHGTGERKATWHPKPFEKEFRIANQRQQEAQARRQARDEAIREREERTAERERFRKAMAKARTGGRNGQRKLGRESGVLLEKIQRSLGS